MGEIREIADSYSRLAKLTISELKEQAALLEREVTKDEKAVAHEHALLQENYWAAYVIHLKSYLPKLN